MKTELLAQLIEEVSVVAADRRRKEPRTITRPWENTDEPKTGMTGSLETGIQARGLAGMLGVARTLGMVGGHA
jgi:hypothetical protein